MPTGARVRSHHVYRRGGKIEVFGYHAKADVSGIRLAIIAKQFGLSVDELKRLL